VVVPGGVGVARRDQRHRGRRCCLGEPLQAVLPRLGERTELAHGLRMEDFRDHARQHAPVLQRRADALGPSRVVGDDAPGAVRPPHQVGRVAAEPAFETKPLRRAARAQECRVAVDQCRREGAVGQQSLRAVDVAEDRLEQTRALRETGGERGELGLGEQQRDRVAATRVRLGAWEHARGPFLLERPIEAGRPFQQRIAPEFGERPEQVAPVRTQPAPAVHHLIERGGCAHALSICPTQAQDARVLGQERLGAD